MRVTAQLALWGLIAAGPAFAGSFTQTNLVSDGAIPAAHTDPNLKNPWGVSFSPTGAFWVSDNATGLSTLYDGTGTIVPLVVTIPPAKAGNTGNPTGQVFNSGTSFVVSNGTKSGASVFIFCSEDGTISGWSPSVDQNNAFLAYTSKTGAVFKGLALVTGTKGQQYLFATDFHNGVIDVFDDHFRLTKSFADSAVPKGYAPYNVQNLGGKIFVTYAKQDAAKHDSVSGRGLGAVEQIDSDGHVLLRAVGGFLNAPWGLAIAPSNFGSMAGKLLVGNFGDGRITAFKASLHQAGQLKASTGAKLSIDGLWDLTPGNGAGAGSAATLYFTAGPNGEADGLLGAIDYAP